MSTWVSPRLVVQIVTRNGSSFKNGAYDSRPCLVKSVDVRSSTAVLKPMDSNESLSSVPIDLIDPVRPEKKDNAKVVSGDYVNSIGLLLSIDGTDGIFRIEGHSDFKILGLNDLVKYIKE